jgi:hypothetical protein
MCFSYTLCSLALKHTVNALRNNRDKRNDYCRYSGKKIMKAIEQMRVNLMSVYYKEERIVDAITYFIHASSSVMYISLCKVERRIKSTGRYRCVAWNKCHKLEIMKWKCRRRKRLNEPEFYVVRMYDETVSLEVRQIIWCHITQTTCFFLMRTNVMQEVYTAYTWRFWSFQTPAAGEYRNTFSIFLKVFVCNLCCVSSFFPHVYHNFTEKDT